MGQNQGTTAHYIYNSYLLMVIPIFFSVGIISVMVRPHFLIMMAKLYNEVIVIDNEAINMEKNSGSLFFAKLFLTIFILLFAALIYFYFYGDAYYQNIINSMKL